MVSGINMFVSFPEAEMTVYIMIMLTIITVANIFAGKIVMGGGRYIFYFFASILTIMTGIVYIVAPYIVAMFFNIPVFPGGIMHEGFSPSDPTICRHPYSRVDSGPV